MRWFPRRRPSAEQLEQWLHTGEPAWVERWVDDPIVETHLEHLSALDQDLVGELHVSIAPPAGFHERAAVGVRERVDDLDRLRALAGLMTLGPRTVLSLFESEAD